MDQTMTLYITHEELQMLRQVLSNLIKPPGEVKSLTVEEKLVQMDKINVMGSIDEIKKLFLKEFRVILYHPQIESKIMNKYIQQIQTLCEVNIFSDWKQAINFIAKNQAVEYLVITSEINGEGFVQGIWTMPNIFSIIVYKEDSNIMASWTNNYNKISFIETDFLVISMIVQKEVAKWQRKNSSLRLDFPMFSPIFNDYELSENNYLRLYLTELVKFTNREQSKEDFLKLARAIYTDTHNMDSFEKNYHDFNRISIFEWYTKESFLYKLTNNCLRLAKADTVYYCSFILKDLEAAIKEQYKMKSHCFNGMLYRAAYISTQDWNRLEENQGKEIEMHGFLSTSKSPTVAEFFAQENTDKKVMITIIVPALPDIQGQGFAEIAEYSVVSDEDEILFNIRSRFTILQAHLKQVNGVMYRHLLLFYGAQDLRRFMSLNNPVIHLKLNNIKELQCTLCKVNNVIEKIDMFVNLEDTKEYVCSSCVINSNNLNISALARVNSSLNDHFKIEGMILKYQENTEFWFCGYKCTNCSNEKVKRKFICQPCKNKAKEWCNSCYDENNSCVQSNHFIIVENQRYTFWSEKMRENEDMDESNEKKCLDQGEVLLSTLDFKKAQEYYQEILKLNNGRRNETSAKYNLKLGDTFQKLGEFYRAIDCYQIGLEIFKEIEGDDHPLTVYPLASLGFVYKLLGQFEKALKYCLNALEVLEKSSGRNNPKIVSHHINLGLLYQDLDRYSEAKTILLSALELSKVFYGDKSEETATAYNNLSLVCTAMGQFKEAQEFGLNALRILKIIFGDKNPFTISCYVNLGSLYHDIGLFSESEECRLKAFKIRREMYGEKHIEIATSYTNMGSIYAAVGQLGEAKKSLIKALEILKEADGERNLDTVTVYNELGFVYLQLEKFKKSIEYYSKALALGKVIYGEKSSHIAKIEISIGTAYQSLEKFQVAEGRYLKALEILHRIYEGPHHLKAVAYNNLGTVYEMSGQFQKAVKHHKLSLNIRKEALPKNHPYTAASYSNLAITYFEMKKRNKAIKYQLISMEIWEAANQKKNLELCYMCLIIMYEALGKSKEAMHYRVKLEQF